MPDEAEPLIGALTPRTFRAKQDALRRSRAGFIADEVPSLLSTSGKDALYLDGILSVLVAVVKDLRRQLAEVRG